MKTMLAAAAAFFVVPAAFAHASDRGDLAYNANQARHKVVMRYGNDAAGRDIVKYGIRFVAADHSKQVRKAKPSELRDYTAQLRRIIAPPPHPTLLRRTVVPPAQAPAGTQTASVRAPAGGVLARIRACESGGNYSTNTGNGFYGAYQFDQQTWQSVGGSGLASNASPAEQDRLAAKLYAQRGAAPWPVCGR